MFALLYELKRQMCQTEFRMKQKDAVKNCERAVNSELVVQDITYDDKIVMNFTQTTFLLSYCLIIWVV